MHQKKDKAYYYDTEILPKEITEVNSPATKREKDGVELTPRKIPDGLPNEKVDRLVKEIAEMGEVNQHFLSVKESDDMGVSMISMTDDTTFRI